MGTLTVKGGTLTIVGGSSTPVAKLNAALAQASTSPVRVVFTGSSTTQGYYASTPANQYVNRLVTMMQAAYPSGGVEAAVVASTSSTFGTPSATKGVQGYNAGEAGDTSANYLNSTRVSNIAALSPKMVMHMIGVNDWSTNVLPATYQANVQAQVTAIKNAVPGVVQILVQSYGISGSPTYPWAQYGQALRQIADADPTNVAFVDLSSLYSFFNVVGADPLAVLGADKTHQTDLGHGIMANALRLALRIPPSSDTTAPSTPTGLTATAGTAQVALSWTASTDNVGVSGYKVYRGGTLVASPTGTSYTDGGLAGGTAYTYTVSAVDAGGNESAQSTSATATAIAAGPTTLSADNFNRADSSLAGQTTPTGGKTWTLHPSGGTSDVFSIVGNVMGPTTVANTTFCDVDSGASDVTVQATIAALGTGPGNQGGGLAVRISDGLNGFWLSTRINGTTAGFTFFRYNAGTIGAVGNSYTTSVPTVGQVLKIVASGSTLTAYVNGVQACTVTDTFNQTATKHGVLANTGGMATRWDDFSVTTP